MPAEFDKLRLKIKKQLKDKGLSEEEAEKRSWAISTAQWKKSHGGKSPTEGLMLEYSIPISVKEYSVDSGIKDFIIQGTAISETTTMNNHKYIAEELIKSVDSLINKPLLVDHEQKVENIKGRVLNASWNEKDKRIEFEAKVTDEKVKDMIKEGVLNTVSVGAYAQELIEDKDGSMIAKGIKFAELSFVPCPADNNATFVMAMMEALKLKEQDEENEEEDEFEPDKSLSPNTDEKLKGGLEMENQTENNSVKVIEELQAKLKEYQLKERKTLEESYKTLCKEKSVKEMDISNLSDEAVTLLKDQISSVKSPAIEKSVTEEKADGFVLEKTGKGFSLYKV